MTSCTNPLILQLYIALQISSHHQDSNNRMASPTEGPIDVVQAHSQLFVNNCPRILSFGSNSRSGTLSKSISL